MSKLNQQKFGLNSVFAKMREKYKEMDAPLRSSSQSVEIKYTKEIIVKNVYKKTKIIIKRPEKIDIKKKKTKSISAEKYKKIKYLTYKKKTKYGNNINTINITSYKNISMTSVKNKNNKYVDMAKDNLVSLYNKKDEKEKNKKILILTNIINKMYMKYIKEKYANKMRTILNYYSKNEKEEKDKNYNNETYKSHKSSKKHSDSSSCDVKNKNKIKINLDYNNSNSKKRKHHKSNIINRNNSSKRESFEENIKIISIMDVKPINSSEDENYNNSIRNLSKDNNNKISSENKPNPNLFNRNNEENEKKDDFINILKKIKKSQINKSISNNKDKSNEKINYMNYKSNEKFYYNNNNYENDDFLEENNNNFFPNDSQSQNYNNYNYIPKTSRTINSNEKEEIFNNNIPDNPKKKKSGININRRNTFNDTEFDNNIYIKQTMPTYINYEENEFENDEKDLNNNNKNYINNINITYNNIINNQSNKNSQTLDNTDKNKKFTPKNNNNNNINIMDLISPVKEEEQIMQNKKYFNPDKNIDKKIKISQIKNKIMDLDILFKNYQNLQNKKKIPKGNINIKKYKNSIPKSNSKKTNNKDVHNELNNKIEINAFSYEKENISDNSDNENENVDNQNQNGKKQSILFEESNNDSYSNYKNNLLDSVNNEKDKKELQIQTLTEDSNINNDNTNRYNMNISMKNDMIEDSNIYHNNDIPNDININIDLKKQINTLDEDDFEHEPEKNTQITNNNKYISDRSKNNNNEIIQKSEEIFYPVKSNDLIDFNSNNSLNNNISVSESSINKEKNNSKDNTDLNSKYLEYKIIDKKRRIISFLSNNKNSANKNNKKVKKVRISLNSYLYIINLIIHENEGEDGDEDEEKEDKKDIAVKPISIRFYQNCIQRLIEEINSENEEKENSNSSYNSNGWKNNIFLNIQKFDDKIKSFKKYIIYLLVKKHYLKSEKLKQKLILEKNNSVIEHEKDIYEFFIFLKTCIISLKDNNYNNQKKKEYKMMILDILNNYAKINLRDVAIAQKLYKEGKINKYISINKNKIHKYKYKYNISPDKKGEKVFDKKNLKSFITLSFLVIPLIYIYNYFDSNQKQISLI